MHQETDYIKTKEVFPWDPFQDAPGDRLHKDKGSLPLGPFSGCTRRQTTYKDKGVFPWDLHQETDHIKTNKPSPGTLFRVHQETDHMKTKESSPGTCTRRQAT